MCSCLLQVLALYTCGCYKQLEQILLLLSLGASLLLL